MIPAAFAYARADSVDEAIALLAEHGDDAKLLAGGHSLLPLMKLRLATPSVLVDVGRLARPLVRPRRRRSRRHRRAHPPPRRRARRAARASTSRCSRAAAGEVGDPQVRHRGTLGGSLAHGDPASDLPAVVLALGGDDRRAGAERRARHRAPTTSSSASSRPRSRPTRSSPRSACRRPAARAGRSRSSTGAPRTGRSSASPRSAGRQPGRRAGEHGLHAGPGPAVEAALARRRVERRRGRASRPTAPTAVRPQRHRPSTAVTSQRVLVGRSTPSTPSPAGRRPMTATTFGAGSLVGVPVRRVEDPTLLRGEATYIDNLALPGALHLAFVRSSYAHARAHRGRHRRRARDARRGRRSTPPAISDFPDHTGMMQLNPAWCGPPLARDTGALRRRRDRGRRRRDARPQAVDAAETVVVDYEPLAAVTDIEAALAPDAPVQFEALGSNVVAASRARRLRPARRRRGRRARPLREPARRGGADGGLGDRGGPRRRRRRPRAHRVPRVPDAALEPERAWPANFGVEPEKVRLIAPHVGGSFGAKHWAPEEHRRGARWRASSADR